MIELQKNPNGDTRTAPNNVTFEDFQEANTMHINDVSNVMKEISKLIRLQGSTHDWTKKSEEVLFFSDFLATKNNNADFVNEKWYQYHIRNEKHHPLSYCHKDVNLLDLIEMIVDCVCAGKTRKGEIDNIEIPNDILKLAVENTVKLIDNMTECK